MKYAVLKGNERFEIKYGDLKVNGNPIIKVTHVGVCGTDMSYWKSGNKYDDIVIGHEYSGVIENPGNSCEFRKGDRVAGYTQNILNENCGHCEECLSGDFEKCTNRTVVTWKGGELNHPGAYSQYTTWFPGSIFKIPDNVTNEEAALAEPFAVGLHAVVLSEIKPGDKVLILGGGIIGLTVAEWAKTFGAGEVTITELNDKKIECIKKYNVADHIVKANSEKLVEQLLDISEGGFDIVFDCVGVPTAFNSALKALKPEKKMRVTVLALPSCDFVIDYQTIVLKEIVLRGSKGHTPKEFKTVINAIANNSISIKKYISKRIKFENIQEEFKQMKSEGGIQTKVIIEMD